MMFLDQIAHEPIRRAYRTGHAMPVKMRLYGKKVGRCEECGRPSTLRKQFKAMPERGESHAEQKKLNEAARQKLIREREAWLKEPIIHLRCSKARLNRRQ